MWLYTVDSEAGVVPIVLDEPEPPTGTRLTWRRVAEVRSREDVSAELDRIDPRRQLSR